MREPDSIIMGNRESLMKENEFAKITSSDHGYYSGDCVVINLGPKGLKGIVYKLLKSIKIFGYPLFHYECLMICDSCYVTYTITSTSTYTFEVNGCE